MCLVCYVCFLLFKADSRNLDSFAAEQLFDVPVHDAVGSEASHARLW